jgi:hypothetical protein
MPHVPLYHSQLKPAQALDRLDPSSPASRKCLRELRIIGGDRAMLPTSYILPSQLLEISPTPFTYGGSCDVYKGIFSGSEVCVKRVRVYSQDALQTAANSKVRFGAFPFPAARNH